ncbi:uracil-DNA glycosylase [Kocuria rhizophila]|nr:uracil-DNA glycosylase [Kocuria rhizophila]
MSHDHAYLQPPHPLTGSRSRSPAPPAWAAGGPSTADAPRPTTPPRCGTPRPPPRTWTSSTGWPACAVRASASCSGVRTWPDQARILRGEPAPAGPCRPTHPRARIAIIGLAPAANGNLHRRACSRDRAGDWDGRGAAPRRIRRARDREHRGRRAGPARGPRWSPRRRARPPSPPPTRRPRAVAGLDREIALLTQLRGVLALARIAWQTALARPCGMGWQAPRRAPQSRARRRRRPCAPGRPARAARGGCYHVSQRNTFTRAPTASRRRRRPRWPPRRPPQHGPHRRRDRRPRRGGS